MSKKLLLLLLMIPIVCADSAAQSRIIWLDNDTGSPKLGSEQPPRFRTAWLDGSHVQTIRQASLATGMAFDHTTGLIYWTQYPLGHGSYGDMWRFQASTGGANQLLLSTGWTEGGLAIDHVAQKIYWATRVRDMNRVTIMQANLDGSDPQELAPDVSPVCSGIAVDPVGRHVYWTTKEEILRVNIDTKVVEEVSPDPSKPPYPSFSGGISIDSKAQKMYWLRRGNRSSSGFMGIFRADLDGKNAELLWEETYADATDIVVDGENKYVYWSQWATFIEPVGVYVRRARIDQPIEWNTIENVAGPPETPSDLPVWFDLFVDPGPPQLTYPADEASNVPTTEDLIWAPVECSDRYDVQVAADPEFNSLVYRTNTPHRVASFVAPVAEHRYWWRIHSNACGWASRWSSPRWFDVGKVGPLAAILQEPANASQTGLSVTFSWIPPEAAEFQTFQLSTESDFKSVVINIDSLSKTTETIDAADLVTGQPYYWRVAGYNEEGQYTFSLPYMFSVVQKASALSLLSPSDGSAEVAAYPEFSWTSAEGADTYRFQLSLTNDFAAAEIDTLLDATSIVLAAPLGYTMEYYWRVCGVNIVGDGPWAEASFTVAIGTATENEDELPAVTRLANMYPNPTSGVVTIPFDLARTGRVQLDVFDVFGRYVSGLMDEHLTAGRYERSANVGHLASGTYVAVLKVGSVNSRSVFTIVR